MVGAGAAPVLAGWRTEPADVQRAMLWLLSASPELLAERQDLVGEDAVVALEDWICSGAD